MGAVLGVPTLTYLPYCIFNIASPIISVLYGFTGFRVTKLEPTAPNLAGAEPRPLLAEPAPAEGSGTAHD
jgi:NhaC family Na+:H+ antiporter